MRDRVVVLSREKLLFSEGCTKQANKQISGKRSGDQHIYCLGHLSAKKDTSLNDRSMGQSHLWPKETQLSVGASNCSGLRQQRNQPALAVHRWQPPKVGRVLGAVL